MNIAINNYFNYLEMKYQNRIRNQWVFTVIALIALIGVFGYAFYCSSRGASFAGGIKFGFPKLIEVSFNCKK
jgi:preprotein translocase subunit SecF